MNSLELMEILKSKQSQSVMFDYTTLRLIFEDRDYIEFHRDPTRFTYTQVKYKTLSEIVNKNKGLFANFRWHDDGWYKAGDLTFKNGDSVDFNYKFGEADLIKSEEWRGYIETLELKGKEKKLIIL